MAESGQAEISLRARFNRPSTNRSEGNLLTGNAKFGPGIFLPNLERSGIQLTSLTAGWAVKELIVRDRLVGECAGSDQPAFCVHRGRCS